MEVAREQTWKGTPPTDHKKKIRRQTCTYYVVVHSSSKLQIGMEVAL